MLPVHETQDHEEQMDRMQFILVIASYNQKRFWLDTLLKHLTRPVILVSYASLAWRQS